MRSGLPPLSPSPLQGSVEGTPPTAHAVSVSPAVGLPPATSWASSAPWESVALAADGTPPSNRPALQPGATSPPVVPIQGFDFSQGFMSVGASSAELVSATSTSHNHPPAEPYHNSLQSVGTSVGADLVVASSTPARVGQCGCVRKLGRHARRKRRKLRAGPRTDVTQEVLHTPGTSLATHTDGSWQSVVIADQASKLTSPSTTAPPAKAQRHQRPPQHMCLSFRAPAWRGRRWLASNWCPQHKECSSTRAPARRPGRPASNRRPPVKSTCCRAPARRLWPRRRATHFGLGCAAAEEILVGPGVPLSGPGATPVTSPKGP